MLDVINSYNVTVKLDTAEPVLNYPAAALVEEKPF